MDDPKPPSQRSLLDATKSRASFSGHGRSLGAAGKRVASLNPDNYVDLRQPGQEIFINPSEHGAFDFINIGGAWNNVVTQEAGFFSKLIKKACLLYTSPSPRDRTRSRMPSSA